MLGGVFDQLMEIAFAAGGDRATVEPGGRRAGDAQTNTQFNVGVDFGLGRGVRPVVVPLREIAQGSLGDFGERLCR